MKGIKDAYSLRSIVERTPSRLRNILAKQYWLKGSYGVVDGHIV